MDLHKIFEKFNKEYTQFQNVKDKLYHRPDICAFLLLDKLVTDIENRDMVSAAGHDEIWLDVDCEKLAAVATEEDILTLTRCGVRYDNGTDSLAMFT